MSVSIGLTRQPSNSLKNLTVNRQKIKVIFYRQPSKSFKVFQLLTTSTDLNGLLAPEESFNWKNQGPCSQKHSLDITRPYNCPIP